VHWRRLFGRGEAPPSGPRRRSEERFGLAVKLTARCSSWPRFFDLMSGDVSAGGLFVPTEEPAELGEKIELDLGLPDGTTLPMTGVVVAVVSAEQAARAGKGRGLGIKLDAPTGTSALRFGELLGAARQAQPRPVESQSIPIELEDALPEEEEAPARPDKSEPLPITVDDSQVTARPTRPSRPRIVGIDLGTSYTSVAVMRGRKVVVLPFADGQKSLASVVSFPQPGKVLVGAEARARVAMDPEHTVVSPKRILGRRIDEPEVENLLAQVPYRTYPAPDRTALVEMWREPYAISQLCAYLLAEAKATAERALGEEVSHAVITVPVTFEEHRVAQIRRAAKLARLEVVATIDEPSAAALANRFTPGFGGTVGVYDFGGGTFDFTVVDVSRGDFSVLATAGDSWLGGDDFDHAIADAVANRVWQMHNVDLRRQQVEWQRLLYACELAKRELSTADETKIVLPAGLRTARGTEDIRFRFDRSMLERVCAPVIDRSLATCREALELVEIDPRQLSAIYLSGGTTYVPAVRSALQRELGVAIRTGVPPEHAVCLGAGIHAAQLELQGRTTL
jgi:actin-like ATPase involved in cell morphogenesis/Tfp pilus assembly protein PilZ